MSDFLFFLRFSSKELNVWETLFAGGMSGVLGWVVMLPPDTIKSRIQSAEPGTYKGMVDCFGQLVKNEGYAALYKGAGPVFLRAFPANAACFLGYEYGMKILNKLVKD